MMLGRVIGQLVCTRKHPAVDGYRLLVVKPHGRLYEPAHDTDLIVAIDVVGAGPGEDVLVCFGEPARRSSLRAHELPIEAAVAAIVDRTEWLPGANVMPEASSPTDREA